MLACDPLCSLVLPCAESLVLDCARLCLRRPGCHVHFLMPLMLMLMLMLALMPALILYLRRPLSNSVNTDPVFSLER